jgi:ferredoxin-NADP reductase
MSSAPETDDELMTTVKRVPGGAVSNWFHDELAEGDEIELMPPAGLFCLREAPESVPVLGFSGGSGITPIMSLAKSALAATGRRVRLLCADRDKASAIFADQLTDLAARHPGRLEVVRRFDDEHGFVDAGAVAEFVGPDGAADAYVCGPEPFMALVESALPGPGRVFSERFGGDIPALPGTPALEAPAEPAEMAEPAETAQPARPASGGTVTITLGRKKVQVPRRPDETVLESARRGGLTPPFSCESGNCATCIARLVDGEVRMRVNDVLEDDEVADGYILTCQSVPETTDVTVLYE